MATISASEANRSFSSLLRQVAQGERFTVLSRGRPVAAPIFTTDALFPADAQEAVLSWMDSYSLVETSSDVWRGAMDLCVAHQMSSWDALVLNASAVTVRMKAAFRRYQQIPAPLAHEGQGFVHEAVNTHQLRSCQRWRFCRP